MMKQVMTGSTGSLLSSMHFMQNGELLIEQGKNLESIDPIDFASLSVTQEFILYALERDDWMIEFLEIMDNKLKKEESKTNQPKLTLIPGGKDEN